MYLNSTLPKLLGSCFYYAPNSEIMQSVIPILIELPDLFPWTDAYAIESLSTELSAIAPQDLQYDYSILFEGQGIMPAPPWGSYYLEVDQLLMGESTIAFRNFLYNCGIELSTQHKEPEDQFGLMLFALSIMLDKKEINHAQKLLNNFLLPWALRYLNLVQSASLDHGFYPNLAKISEQYLQQLKTYFN